MEIRTVTEEIAGLIAAVIVIAVIIAIIIAILMRKEFIVKAIETDKPLKWGDIVLDSGIITIRTILGPKQFRVADIQSVEGYEEVDMGLEHHSCIDVVFTGGKKLLFCGTNSTHQQFLNNLLAKYLQVSPIDWEKGFHSPFTTKREVLYERQV